MKTIVYATLITWICSFSSLFSQVQAVPQEPAKWTVEYKALNDQEGEIVLTASIEKTWHIYSQRATDAGPVPTSFSFVNSPDYQLIGDVQEEGVHEQYDKAFDAKVWTLEGKAVFRQKIHLNNSKGFLLALSLEYMACDDSKCIPPSTHQFQVKVPALPQK